MGGITVSIPSPQMYSVEGDSYQSVIMLQSCVNKSIFKVLKAIKGMNFHLYGFDHSCGFLYEVI